MARTSGFTRMGRRVPGRTVAPLIFCLVNCLWISSAGQTRVWTDRYDAGYAGADRPVGVRTDAYGNIYVAGSSWRGPTRNFDVFVAKYSPVGARDWVTHFDGPSHGVDYANHMVIDGGGNVFVAGCSEGSGSSYDWLTIKVSSTGSIVWTARYNGPGNGTDEARHIAVDASGSVYVCGHAAGLNNYDWTVVKYNSSGALQWVKQFDGGGHDFARALTVDASGNIIVTGGYYAGTASGMDCLTIKYSPSGAVAWQRTYDGPAKGVDQGVAVATQPDGRVVVVAESQGRGTWRDFAILGYTSGGTLSWTSRHDGTASKDDIPVAIVLDPAGNVYVTGSSATLAGTRDILVVSVDGNGVMRWSVVLDRAGRDDIATGISVDHTCVAVVGSTDHNSSVPRMLTACMSLGGTVQWDDEYVGPSGGRNEGCAIWCDGAGRVVAVGTSWGGFGSEMDAVTIAYAAGVVVPTTISVPDRSGTITELVTLRGYLKRTNDNAWLDGRTIVFRVDGTEVGSAVTGATGTSGRADLNWTITEGAATRTIQAEFAGDAFYSGSFGTATLTCQSWGTKMATFDRTARITGRTELKARLLRSDNVPLYNKQINFYVDGTFVISRPTNTQGYASYPYYDVPDGAGAGARTILSEWPGNGGYAAISKTATLTVLKALPYIWVMPRSVPQGAVYRLYCYFRRLNDYKKMENRTLAFSIDGTWIADVTTGAGQTDPGVARYNFDTSVLSKGEHTARCDWAGDAWVDAGFGEGRLTVY